MSEENKKAREDALRARLEFLKQGGLVEYECDQHWNLSFRQRHFLAGFEEAMRTLGMKP